MKRMSPIEQLNAAIAADPAAFTPEPEQPAWAITVRGGYSIGDRPR